MKTNISITLTGIANLTIPVKKIGKSYYGAARCFVSFGGAEIPAYAVACKDGKNIKKWICTYTDCAMRLIEWGLSVEQARKLLDSVALESDRVDITQ
jgi:hypothetical protein